MAFDFAQAERSLGITAPQIDRLVLVQPLPRLGHRVFQPGGAVEQHHAFVLVDQIVAHRLVIGRQRRPALGAEQQAILLRAILDGLEDRRVAHRQCGTARFTNRAQDQEVADGFGHADARCHCGGIFPTLSMFLARLIGADDGRTAACLYRIHARALGADPAQPLHLVERLPHADQAGAAASRIEDRIGQFPAQLSGQFQAHRLLALDPIGLLQRREVEPASLRRAAPDDRAALVDLAVDPPHARALRGDLADIHFGRFLGAEDHRLDPAARRIGGQRGARIAVGRHRDPVHAQLARHGDGHDQPARLERAGRQPPLILTSTWPPPERGIGINGVSISPSDTMLSVRRTGKVRASAIGPFRARRWCRVTPPGPAPPDRSAPAAGGLRATGREAGRLHSARRSASIPDG